MDNNFTENWKKVVGYEDYEVSDLGNVRSLKNGKVKILKPGISKPKGRETGYLCVVLSNNGKTKNFFVHRLVVTVFIGPIPKGMVVNHINENKLDNRLSNLEIVTQKENSNHGTRNKRIAMANRGKKRGKYNVSPEGRLKQSLARKGKPHTEETKAKISVINKGKKLSEEHKAKISNANLGKKRSEETKAKISANEKGNTKRRKALTLIDINSCGRYRFNSSYEASDFFGYSGVTKIGGKISNARKLGKNYIVIAGRKYRFFQE